MIDVALGMALLYAVLSLFVTTIQELVVNSAMRWRSRHMRKTVKSAFGEDKALTEAFFAHPLIVSLSDGRGGRAPSYIPNDLFAKAFLAVLGHGSHPMTQGLSPAGFLATLQPSGGAPRTGGLQDLSSSLRLATTDSVGTGLGDWPSFEADVARWFGGIGERSRGWFKRSSQRWTLAIALLIAVGLNVDSIMIARTLWGDAELRKQLADAAVAIDRAVNASAAPGSAPRVAPARESLEDRYAQLESGLGLLATRLTKEFSQTNGADAIRCDMVDASCFARPVFDRHCKQERGLLLPAPKSCKAAESASPSIRWLDQVVDLSARLRLSRQAGTERGGALQLDTDRQALLEKVQRSMDFIFEDMQFVAARLGEGKSGDTIRSLSGDLARLREQAGDLFRFIQPTSMEFDRATAECALQFAKGSSQLSTCVQRRQAEQPFPLPLGFQSSVLARQMSDADLRLCAAARDGCGTLNQLGSAVLNGALIGWLLTAVALSLGAPFWFDTLGRLVKLRASGTATSDKDDDKQTTDKRTGNNKDSAPASSGTQASAPALTPASGTFDATTPIEATLSTDEIRSLQRKLQVAASGVFDNSTRNAIAARRAQLDMPPGAELDGTLYEAIIERRSPSVQARPVLTPGDSSPLVPDLRERLTAILTIPARVQGTGDVFDDGLRAAVRLLQGRAGLVPDGVVGEQTWRVIDAGNGAACAADAWMSRAISQLGLDETRDKEEVRKFLATLNLGQFDPASTAWCACFIAWAIQNVGPPPPANTPEGARNWDGWGRKLNVGATTLPYGAVVLLREAKVRTGSAPQHHVAFLVGTTASGWVMFGGNQGNQGEVSVTLFSSDSHEVVYAGMPGAAI